MNNKKAIMDSFITDFKNISPCKLGKIQDINQFSINLADLYLDTSLYQRGVFSQIDKHRRVIGLHTYSDLKLCFNQGLVIKTEQLERYSRTLRQASTSVIAEAYNKHSDRYVLTIHSFDCPGPDGVSFDTHEDDCDVIVVCIEGIKSYYIETDNGSDIVTLNTGDFLTIPKGIRHRAINEHRNIILSLGAEEFIVKYMEN